MTDHPQEHESLDQFIEKVEASGEDKKYDRAGDPRMLADLDAYQERYETRQPGGRHMLFSARHFFQEGWKANEESRGPIYTQAQRDAYAAEAVKQARERILYIVDAAKEEASQMAEHVKISGTLRGEVEQWNCRAHEAMLIGNRIRRDQP